MEEALNLPSDRLLDDDDDDDDNDDDDEDDDVPCYPPEFSRIRLSVLQLRLTCK